MSSLIRDLFDLAFVVALLFTVIYVPVAVLRALLHLKSLPSLLSEVRQLRVEVAELKRRADPPRDQEESGT